MLSNAFSKSTKTYKAATNIRCDDAQCVDVFNAGAPCPKSCLLVTQERNNREGQPAVYYLGMILLLVFKIVMAQLIVYKHSIFHYAHADKTNKCGFIVKQKMRFIYHPSLEVFELECLINCPLTAQLASHLCQEACCFASAFDILTRGRWLA